MGAKSFNENSAVATVIMVTLWIILPIMLGLAPHQVSTFRLDALDMWNVTLTPNNPKTIYTSAAVIQANLGTLKTRLSSLLTPLLTRITLLKTNGYTNEVDTVFYHQFRAIFHYALPLVNQLSASFLNIANARMKNLVLAPTSEPKLVASIAGLIGTNSLTPINSGIDYTNSTLLAKNLNDFFSHLHRIVPIMVETSLTSITDINVAVGYGIACLAFGVPILVVELRQLTKIALESVPIPLITFVRSPNDLLVLLEQAKVAANASLNYFPANTSLSSPDTYMDYTCDGEFSSNMARMYALLEKFVPVIVKFVKSQVPVSKVPVARAFNTFFVALPYINGWLAQTVTILNKNQSSPTWSRSLFPDEVRTNLAKSNCHLSYLKRYNARLGGGKE